MTESDLDFVLDGNAAAGALREVFVADMTTAHINATHAAPSEPWVLCPSMQLRWEWC